MTDTDPRAIRAVLTSLLKRGVITQAEAAAVAGVTRQAIAKWLPAAPGEHQARRWRYVIKQVDYALRMRDPLAEVKDKEPRNIP